MKPATLLLLGSTILIGACSAAGQGSSVSRDAGIVPPVIGGSDDLRRGVEPPADPDKIRIATVNLKAGPEGGVTKIRGTALMEAAQSYGSQMGYARRAWEIAGRLETRSSQLSGVFDFGRVVSAAPVQAGVIVPPVASRSFDAFTVNADGTEASVADEYLTIVKPGRIAPVAPTWRDYLIFAAPTPEDPPRSLQPTDANELKKFRDWFSQGWKAGVELADAEFSDRLARLQRDYGGMMQYRRLVALGMMDRMVLADADFGVTGGGNEMRIGSRTVQITSEASFRAEPDRWTLRSVKERNGLIAEIGELPSINAIMY